MGILKDEIQKQYEGWLSGYAGLVHGNEPPGLAAKLATYMELLSQHRKYGEDLWRIDALLAVFINALEVDLHLAMAKLLEAPGRSDRSLFRFLKYCQDNRRLISWQSGSPIDSELQTQLEALEKHRDTIDRLMARRDKFFAHLDKMYFHSPAKIYEDYPLRSEDVIALANSMIKIVADHQRGLGGGISIHTAEFYSIAADNMVRNLLAGRKVNFPGQIDQL